MNTNPNFLILKEPRGFIKAIELVIVIFAFATCAGFTGHFTYTEQCPKVKNVSSEPYGVKADFYYPFDVLDIYKDVPCTGKDTLTIVMASVYQSSSQFFVFTGVVSMLFVFVAVVFYVFFEDQDKDAVSTDVGICSFPVVDFGMSILLALFWFCGSIAWASALAGLKDKTNVETYIKGACSLGATCSVSKHATYGAANVSVVFGFLNFFVWAGNLWFLFKETPWHSPRNAGARPPGEGSVPQEPPRQETPPASI